MVTIQNRLNQRIIINLDGRRNLDLPAKGAVPIPKEDMASPHLQALISSGELIIVQTDEVKKEPAKFVEKRESKPVEDQAAETGPAEIGRAGVIGQTISADSGGREMKPAGEKIQPSAATKPADTGQSKSNATATGKPTARKSADSKS